MPQVTSGEPASSDVSRQALLLFEAGKGSVYRIRARVIYKPTMRGSERQWGGERQPMCRRLFQQGHARTQSQSHAQYLGGALPGAEVAVADDALEALDVQLRRRLRVDAVVVVVCSCISYTRGD